MAWKQWSRQYNERLVTAKVTEKKYHQQKHHEFIEKIITELRAGFGVFVSYCYLARLQWVINNPEFTPRMKLKIEISKPIVKISPLDENGNSIATLYKNMVKTKRYKEKFLVVSRETVRKKLEKDKASKDRASEDKTSEDKEEES